MTRFKVIFTRSRDILQSGGFIILLKRGFDLASSWLYKLEDFYVYEHTIREKYELAFIPQINDFNFKVVRNNDEANDLARTIGFDFRDHIWYSRERLKEGTIAFCIFADGELAHIGWVALTEKAKKVLDHRPYEVDFPNRQALTGGSFTLPKYRAKGLMTYGYLRRFEFIREKGFTTSRNIVSVHNMASNKVHAKLGGRILAQACYLKLLYWEFWKETPVT